MIPYFLMMEIIFLKTEKNARLEEIQT